MSTECALEAANISTIHVQSTSSSTSLDSLVSWLSFFCF
jgi:hypothetical protein